MSEGGAGLVRYSWTADPCNWPALEACNVYSKSGGLPVPPFMLYVDGVAKPSSKATWPPMRESETGRHRQRDGETGRQRQLLQWRPTELPEVCVGPAP